MAITWCTNRHAGEQIAHWNRKFKLSCFFRMSQLVLEHGSFGTSWSLSAENLLKIMLWGLTMTRRSNVVHATDLNYSGQSQKAVRNFEPVTGLFLIWQYYFLVLSHVASSASGKYEATFLLWLATGLLAVRLPLSSLLHSFHTTAILSRAGKKTLFSNSRISSQTYELVHARILFLAFVSRGKPLPAAIQCHGRISQFWIDKTS